MWKRPTSLLELASAHSLSLFLSLSLSLSLSHALSLSQHTHIHAIYLSLFLSLTPPLLSLFAQTLFFQTRTHSPQNMHRHPHALALTLEPTRTCTRTHALFNKDSRCLGASSAAAQLDIVLNTPKTFPEKRPSLIQIKCHSFVSALFALFLIIIFIISLLT